MSCDMFCRSVLLTGCSRGLGLEMVRQLVSRVDILIATCRNPDSAEELKRLAEDHPKIHIMALDMKAPETFEAVAARVQAVVGDQQGLNVLVNNAALGIAEGAKSDPYYVDGMEEMYSVNVVGPVKFTLALLPSLKAAASAAAVRPGDCVQKALVVNISSQLGSIENATSSTYLPYRCTKAALNMATKSLSCQLLPSGVRMVAVHPGWVRTDMGGPQAPLTPPESIRLLLASLEAMPADKTGHFIDFNGKSLPW